MLLIAIKLSLCLKMRKIVTIDFKKTKTKESILFLIIFMWQI
jgi:hypothetical protein